jgi:hypothetical protein
MTLPAGRTSWIAVLALVATTSHAEGFVVLSETGFACKELASAKTHEALRTKKNASAYEVAAAMNLPACEQVDSPGLRLWVVSTDETGSYLRVDHQGSGKYDPRWIPKRMTKAAP